MDVLSYFIDEDMETQVKFPKSDMELEPRTQVSPLPYHVLFTTKENKKIIIKSPANEMKEKEI